MGVFVKLRFALLSARRRRREHASLDRGGFLCYYAFPIIVRRRLPLPQSGSGRSFSDKSYEKSLYFLEISGILNELDYIVLYYPLSLASCHSAQGQGLPTTSAGLRPDMERIMTDNKENLEIDLRELFGVLLHRAWLIALVAVIGAALVFAYTYFMVVPLYQSSTLLYVNNTGINIGSSSFSISSGELTAAQKLVDTYVVILKSRAALNEVIEEAELPYTYEELRNMISAAAVNSTEVFEVVVTSKSPTEAEKIANTIAAVLPDKISDIVNGSDVRIVDYAVVPSHRHSPSYTRNTAIGFLLGAVLAAAIVVLTYLLDENIHSEDYLSQSFPDIPLLSVIPDMHASRQRSGGYYGYGYGYGYGSTSRKHHSQSGSSDSSGGSSGAASA